MKVKYIGPTDNSLIKDKVYETISIERCSYRIVDETGEDFLFPSDEFEIINEYGDWASPMIKEYPFWRENMSPEEFDIERDYFYKNFEDYKKRKYKPLWMQRESRWRNQKGENI